MNDHTLAINFNIGTGSMSDMLPTDTLDVSSLKQDAPDAPVKEFASEEEAEDVRVHELAAIADFIAKNGTTKPTAEDFIPKSQSWRGRKKSTKKVDNPNVLERRGRPRTKFSKTLSFVALGNDTFKRAGRGRAKLGETRERFEVHFTNVDAACEGTHTRDALTALLRANC